MTQSIDNSEWVMQGVIRDPITGALMRVNADGSINVSISGGAGAGTGFTSASTTGSVLAGTLGTNGISLGVPAWLTNAAGGGAGTGFTSTTTAGTAVVGTLNSNGLSLGVPVYLTTAGTVANTNNAGTGVTTATQAGTLVSATLNSNGLSFVNAEPLISSYENMPFPASSSMTNLNGASISQAVAFILPQNGSFSFLRLPVSMSTGSTTLATSAASLSASAVNASTWNAVVYSLGTGASSRSLISVASGSVGWTFLNSISVAANGSQYSITQAVSGFAEGNGYSTNIGYSATTTNMSFVSTNVHTILSGIRWLDINFANSLSAGPYWLVFGYSSSSATNSTGIGGAQTAMLPYSYGLGMSQLNLGIRVMGSTNVANSGAWAVGSFSTAGGGTTSGFDLSFLSSYAGFIRPYFQLLRSA
jgi:hypothetical protein